MTEAARVRAEAAEPIAALLPRCDAAAAAAAGLVAAAGDRLAARVAAGGRVSNAALEADQAAAHGLAWMATYAEAVRLGPDMPRFHEGLARARRARALSVRRSRTRPASARRRGG